MIPELPNSIESEEATLGSILIQPALIVEISDMLEASDFYREVNGLIYAAMLAIWNRGVRPDVRLVIEQLKAQGVNTLSVGPVLGKLINDTPIVYNIRHYAEIVSKMAFLRRLIVASTEIAKLGYDLGRDMSDTQADALAVLNRAIRIRSSDDMVPLKNILDEYYEEVSKGVLPGLPTGYRDYDEITGGLHKSDLVILAARPSVGKTAFMLSLIDSIVSMVERAFRDSNQPIAYSQLFPVFSLEMSRGQLLQRLLSMQTGENLAAVRNRVMSDKQTKNVFEAAGRIYNRPILIDDIPGQRIEHMRTKLLRLSSQHEIGAVFVDYLQLIESGSRTENRVQEVSAISRGLKNLARELNVPVIALSQLSRAVEGRTSHVPMLSDLRDSGSIEQDADQVVFLYREELYNKETEKKGIAELHIAKHRNGPLGIVPLRFDNTTTRFETLTYRTPDGY